MFDMSNFNPLDVEDYGKSKRNGRKGALTIINSPKNGKRLMLSEELIEILDIKDDTIQLGFEGTTLVLGTNLPGTKNRFSLRPLEKRKVIYSSQLIMEITRIQELDFKNKVSFTWYAPIVDEYEGRPIVMFKQEAGEHDD